MGLESSALILTKAFAYLGYGTMSDREYFSNIKGRHSYIHSRISSNELPLSLTYPVQLVCALDAETVFTHFGDIDAGGYLVHDSSLASTKAESIPSIEPDLKERLRDAFSKIGIEDTISSLTQYLEGAKKVKVVDLNYRAILSELSSKFKLLPAQASRYLSSIIVGGVMGLTNLDPEAVSYAVESRFSQKKELLEHNKFLINYVSYLVKASFDTPLKLKPSELTHDELMVVSGNDIIAMAKIVGGLRFQSYYPITPAADESFTIETFEKVEVDGKSLASVIVMQTEDEIAAVSSALGAALTGVRSATATSGPGFSLMVEGLGWGGQNEVPVVITYYQRGAPSTGQPTRGSQSDLLFSLFASHGEFPRIVFSSGDSLEAFYDAVEAFNLAEKYQMPVIHLLDKFLANSIGTMVIPEISNLRLERGKIVYEQKDYKRFNLANPISPRAFLGSKNILWYSGDEHDEMGHIDEDPDNRVKMFDKRMRKLELADSEIPPERRAIYYGHKDADFLLIGWGYSKGVSLDALKDMELEGYKGAYLHLKTFSPFPSNYVQSVLDKFDKERIVSVEHNYLVQAAKVITLNTGKIIEKSILKYTGRPMYRNEVVQGLERILKGEKRVVVAYGA